jgi:zinc transporter ZupT
MTAVLLLATALAGGLLLPLRRLSGRALHVALAAATGILLGAVFLDLLPALEHDDHEHAHAPTTAQHATEPGHDDHSHEGDSHAGHAHADPVTMQRWFAVLAGLLLVYLVESLALRTLDRDDHHRHRSVAWGALLGLTLHAAVRGLDLSIADAATSTSTVPVVALLHRAAEAFALATIFALAGIRVARSRLALICFACVAPVGLLVGRALALSHAPHALGILQGLAAGIFLFVTLCELLPEVFHHREDGLAKIALLGSGVTAAYFLV